MGGAGRRGGKKREKKINDLTFTQFVKRNSVLSPSYFFQEKIFGKCWYVVNKLFWQIPYPSFSLRLSSYRIPRPSFTPLSSPFHCCQLRILFAISLAGVGPTEYSQKKREKIWMMISPFKSPSFPDFSTANFRESVFFSPPVTLLSLNIFWAKKLGSVWCCFIC